MCFQTEKSLQQDNTEAGEDLAKSRDEEKQSCWGERAGQRINIELNRQGWERK